jgi:branched-chain amino acid transport system substrate-binding protein
VYFSASEMPGRGSNEFSLNPPQNQLSQFAANWLFTKTKAKTVSIITLDSTTEEVALPGVVNAAKAMGVKILSNQSVGATVTNFQPQVLNAMVGNPSVIVDMASPADTGAMVKELRQNGYKGPIIGSEAAAQSATYKTAGASVDGLYVPTFWDQALGATSPLTKTFVSGYQKAFAGQPLPDVYGAAAYDAANIVTTAIEHAGTSKDALVQAIGSGTFDGVEGSAISFNSGGFAKLSNTVIQFNAQGATTVVAAG